MADTRVFKMNQGVFPGRVPLALIYRLRKLKNVWSMHIHQITIDNFKSFAEKTVIPFEEGFTTVSGPNGSGKSNIIDSVLFCLGLSSSRTMRAEKLSDLVNNLSKRKEAIVTITFRKTADDLAREAAVQQQMRMGLAQADSGSLPESLESADSTIEDDTPLEPSASTVLTSVQEVSMADLGPDSEFVQVTRRIRGNASGYTSTYYLNGRPTTLAEIHDHLGRFNVSPGTYNVMMQGDVAGIVNMSPMERRKILDEIAGVAEFDRKIEQAERELEATAANIERNTILLNELEGRLEQLASERDHALKYQKLREEKGRYEGMLLAAKYIDLKKAIASTHQNLADARVQKQTAEATIQALVDQIAQTHAALMDLSAQVKKKGEDQYIALTRQIEGFKGQIDRKEAAIRDFDDKMAENARQIRQAELDIARMTENSKGIDEEIANFNHQLTELQGYYDAEVAQYTALNQKFDALTGSTGELSLKRTEARQALTQAEDEWSRLNRDKLDTEAEIKRCQYEMDLRLRGNKEGADKLLVLEQRQANLSRDYSDLSLDKSAFEAQLNQIRMDYAKAQLTFNQAASQYAELKQEHVRMEARQRAYDEVGFGRAVETVLKSDLSGVHGTVSQLGKVDSEFALAMEIALGGRIQNIVVDDEQVASDGIRMLQSRGAGRATFLPLSKIQGFRGLPPLPNDAGVVDFAYNLIENDPRYDSVFSYALGETLIVEDMQAARKLLRKYRMVTLDGSLLEKSGAMTGGSQPNRGKGAFFGGNQLEQELQELVKRLDRAEQNKAVAQKAMTSLELKQDSVNTEYQELLQRYSRVEASLESVKQQIAEIHAAQAAMVDTADLTAQIETLEQTLVSLERRIEQAKIQVDDLRQKLEGIESQLPSAQIEELREQIKEVQFQMEYYDTQMRNVRGDIKTKEMEKNYQDVGIQDCRQRIERANASTVQLTQERASAQEEIDLMAIQIRDLEASTHLLNDELKQLQARRDQVQMRLIDEEKQKSAAERTVEQLEEQIQAFQSRKRELEPQLQRVVIELGDAGIEVEAIDATQLPTPDEVHQNIARLTKRMEAMEPVNMLAIDEFARTEERRDELKEKIQTLSTERETITVKIASYHELKRVTFMKTFESVDQNFRTIFAELSDGSGQLMLTHADDPFLGGLTIHAQPRGKKMLRIEGLSGGEKSLTSLAFVFAIQRTMPAPFYALDEVDQNLDGINAEKLAQMVKQEAKRAQFIVVSLRKPMIEASERTIGVTQRQNGITKVTGIKHRDEQTLMPDGEGGVSNVAAAS